MNQEDPYLTYATECTGSPTVDKYNSVSGYNISIPAYAAIAQKFTPTSLCLQSVTIRAGQEFANITGLDIYILPDVEGSPPNSNGYSWQNNQLGMASKPVSQIPTSYTNLNFILNIKLNNLNPLWLAITPSIYDPEWTVDDDGYIQLEDGDVASSVTALKIKNENWSLRFGDTLVYTTYKTNAGSCINPACTITASS